MNVQTALLAIIAAVLVGGAVVWWMGQPSAAQRRDAEHREQMERLRESADAALEAARALR